MIRAALITAAGLSKRMGEFKPLMDINGTTMIQRLINTYRDCGIDKIAVVTGHRADDIMAALDGQNIDYIYNPDYASTQMFDSVSMGLKYLEDKCDEIYFSPVDVPMLTCETVCVVRDEADEGIVVPIDSGRDGHPVRIPVTVVSSIISFKGEGGLKSAMAACGTPVKKIDVRDPWIYTDADTKSEFDVLVDAAVRLEGRE